MPYIECKDGHTYSRYDSSPYVQDCIKEKALEKEMAHTECLADPVCKESMEFQNTCANITVGTMLFLLLYIAWALLWYKKG
jgi:hypothetical protein